ncbi:MAG: hypothetical protein Fur0044_22790 [Anaerolineae bacterium]
MDTNNTSPLTQATAQEIQLELIRRQQFNNFDGKRVAADLLTHRDWWQAVLMDRGDLIKLRDLDHNIWHVDTLYILATDARNAYRLAELAEDWQADTVEVYEREATNRQLGDSFIEEQRLVEMWWD